MLYQDLREHLLNWSNEQNNPVPLLIGNHAMSRDARLSINSMILYIDSVPPQQRSKSTIARAYKRNLEEIKQAIDDGRHDISEFGYSEFTIYGK